MTSGAQLGISDLNAFGKASTLALELLRWPVHSTSFAGKRWHCSKCSAARFCQGALGLLDFTRAQDAEQPKEERALPGWQLVTAQEWDQPEEETAAPAKAEGTGAAGVLSSQLICVRGREPDVMHMACACPCSLSIKSACVRHVPAIEHEACCGGMWKILMLWPAGAATEEEEEAGGWMEVLRASGEGAEYAEGSSNDGVASAEEEMHVPTVAGLQGSVEVELEGPAAEEAAIDDLADAEVAAADASFGAAEQGEADEGFAVPVENWWGPQEPISRARISRRVGWQQPAAAVTGEKLIDVTMVDDQD